jgi:ferric-dicitrate binding protein FerR (iron transport regulator)
MNCQEVRERLPALIDGELPPGERAEVEAHLGGCEECRAEKHRQEQFTTRVKTSLQDLKPSELFVKGVLERLEDPAKRRREEEATVRRGKLSLIAAVAVLLAALLVALLHSLLRGAPPEAASVEGYDRAFLVARGDGGAEADRELPRRIPPGGTLRTDPGGRARLRLPGGAELALHERSRLRLDRGPVLESGGATVSCRAEPLGVRAGRLTVNVAAEGKAQVALQYGDTVVVRVEKGSARIAADEDRTGWTGAQPCAEGETWRVPADRSRPPEKVK